MFIIVLLLLLIMFIVLDDSDDDNDDFGVILPSLIQQLKNVLSQYPDNGQIIKV